MTQQQRAAARTQVSSRGPASAQLAARRSRAWKLNCLGFLSLAAARELAGLRGRRVEICARSWSASSEGRAELGFEPARTSMRAGIVSMGARALHMKKSSELSDESEEATRDD